MRGRINEAHFPPRCDLFISGDTAANVRDVYRTRRRRRVDCSGATTADYENGLQSIASNVTRGDVSGETMSRVPSPL